MELVETDYFGATGNRLVRRLAEALYGHGRVRTLNDLARIGLPLPKGVVLAEEAHETFLEARGVLERTRGAAWEGGDPLETASDMRVRYVSTPIEAQRNRKICQSLIELGAPIVVVFSENYEKQSEKVALYDVESAGGEGPERKGITDLTLEAASVLGDTPRILWGLEGGQWYPGAAWVSW
jgi:hypothetical protein